MEFFRCKNCLMPSTRPRIEYNKKGVCNACVWHEIKKKNINWGKRWEDLERLCDEHRKKKGWDVIVPASGGKDSTFVADKLKNDLGMNPLTVTFAPQIPSLLDRRNWENFVYSGFDNILITPNVQSYRKYARDSLIEYGLPRQPFVTGISTAIIQTAVEKNIKFIMFAENGEVEYGGVSRTGDLQRFTEKFLIDIYYEGQFDQQKYGDLWKVPKQSDLDDVYVTWMSNFVDWEPEEHAEIAVKKYGLEMPVGGNIGTFTNYSQIGDPGQDLHMYLCFLKYGFGRCCADVSIEIRRGRMSKKQGIKLIEDLDGTYPLEFEETYLDYFQFENSEQWHKTLDRFANIEVLERDSSKTYPWRWKK